MSIRVPSNPDAFFLEFVPEMFQRGTERNKVPAVPYSLSVHLDDDGTYAYRFDGTTLTSVGGDEAFEGDVRVFLSLDDFKELARFARSQATDEVPEAPPIPATFQFPPLETLKGSLKFLLDDLGDKRTVEVYIGDVPRGTAPKATIHTTLDFVASLQGQTIAVDQLLRASGVRIEGDFGYVLRLANAATGKTRRRER